MRYWISLILLVACGVLCLGASYSGKYTALVEVWFNSPGPDTQFGEVIVDFIRAAEEAREALYIAMYDFCGRDDILNALCSASLNLPGFVRVILSSGGSCGGGEDEVAGVLRAAKADVRVLSGIHDRFAVAGQDVLTGSADWTPSSIQTESNSIVKLHSYDIARAYATRFQQLWESAGGG